MWHISLAHPWLMSIRAEVPSQTWLQCLNLLLGHLWNFHILSQEKKFNFSLMPHASLASDTRKPLFAMAFWQNSKVVPESGNPQFKNKSPFTYKIVEFGKKLGPAMLVKPLSFRVKKELIFQVSVFHCLLATTKIIISCVGHWEWGNPKENVPLCLLGWAVQQLQTSP